MYRDSYEDEDVRLSEEDDNPSTSNGGVEETLNIDQDDPEYIEQETKRLSSLSKRLTSKRLSASDKVRLSSLRKSLKSLQEDASRVSLSRKRQTSGTGKQRHIEAWV